MDRLTLKRLKSVSLQLFVDTFGQNMNLTSNPTTLEIYFCEQCKGIIASDAIADITDIANHKCPFCDQDSLILLPKTDYEGNFNPDNFPYPQNILLWNFFNNSDNAINLLSRFSRFGVLRLLPPQLQVLGELTKTHVFIPPDLNLSLELETGENEIIVIKSKTATPITVLFE